MNEREKVKQRRIDSYEKVTKWLIDLSKEVKAVTPGRRYPNIPPTEVQRIAAVIQKGDLLKELQRVTSPTHRQTKFDDGVIDVGMDFSLTMLRLSFPEHDRAIDKGKGQGA